MKSHLATQYPSGAGVSDENRRHDGYNAIWEHIVSKGWIAGSLESDFCKWVGVVSKSCLSMGRAEADLTRRIASVAIQVGSSEFKSL